MYLKGRVSGGPQLAAALARLERALSDQQLSSAVEAGVDVLADEWRAQARSRFGYGPPTGHFIDAIGVKVRPGNQGAAGFVGLTNKVPLAPGEDHPAAYGSTLEFGRAERPARPTLRPAVDKSKNSIVEAMSDVLRQLVSKV